MQTREQLVKSNPEPNKIGQTAEIRQNTAKSAELKQTIHQKNHGKAPSFQGVLIIPHEYKPVPRMLVQDMPLPLADTAISNTRGESYQKVLEKAQQIAESGALEDEEYGTNWFAANPRFQAENAAATQPVSQTAQPEQFASQTTKPENTPASQAGALTAQPKATLSEPQTATFQPKVTAAEPITFIKEQKEIPEVENPADEESSVMEAAAADVVADIKAELEIPELAAEIEAEKKLEKSEKAKPIFSKKKLGLHIGGDHQKTEKKSSEGLKLAPKKPKRSPFALFSKPKRHYSNRPSYDDLINLEAKVGRTVFGPIPEGHRREFFEHRKNVWFWHESYVDNSGVTRDTTVFYEVRPTGVFKQLLGSASYKKVEGEELTNFRTAAKTYLDLIKTKVYSQTA